MARHPLAALEIGYLAKRVDMIFIKVRTVLGRPTIDESYRDEIDNPMCEIESLLERSLMDKDRQLLNEAIHRLVGEHIVVLNYSARHSKQGQ